MESISDFTVRKPVTSFAKGWSWQERGCGIEGRSVSVQLPAYVSSTKWHWQQGAHQQAQENAGRSSGHAHEGRVEALAEHARFPNNKAMWPSRFSHAGIQARPSAGTKWLGKSLFVSLALMQMHKAIPDLKMPGAKLELTSSLCLLRPCAQ